MNLTAKIMRRAHAVLFVLLTLMAIILERTNGWPK